MSNLPKLNQLLKSQSIKADSIEATRLLDYAEYVSRIENVTAVVSDLRRGTSRIFPGKFGIVLGIANYSEEDSILGKRPFSI